MTANATLEARLDAVLARLPGGVCAADDWRLLYANAGLRELLGVGAAEPLRTADAKPGASTAGGALSRWFAEGALEGFGPHDAEAGSTPGEGRLLFRHGAGQTYLLH